MRRSLLFVLLSTLLGAAEAPVLVIAFGPFAGRGENGSATLAAGLEGRSIGGHRIVTAVLPVRWGEPEAQLPALIERHRPCLILGLGEGHPGRVAIETRAANRRAHPDEAGRSPTPQIEVDGPEYRASTLVIDPAALPAAAVPVLHSKDAGSYLCNNLLWTCLAQAEVPAGFVHLPPQGSEDDAAYRERFGAVIEALLTLAVQQ